MGRRKANAAPPPPPALKMFRVLAAEFASVDDDAVTAWLELTAPLVSKKRFGKLYDQALALLAAHRMKMSGSFDETADGEGGGGMGGIAAGLRVASYDSDKLAGTKNAWYCDMTMEMLLNGVKTYLDAGLMFLLDDDGTLDAEFIEAMDSIPILSIAMLGGWSREGGDL